VTTEDQNPEEVQQPENPEVGEAKPAPRRRASSRTSASTEGEAAPEADAPVSETGAEEKPAPRRRTSRARAEASSDDAPSGGPVTPKPLPRMLVRLRNDIGPTMVQEFGYTSVMQIPRLSKIVLNIGLGESLTNARALESAIRDMTLITGQRPLTTRAKKSIAGFKIREGMPIGVSVTLRGRRMYEFIDRLISSTLPRIRDFQGLSRKAFDGRGNFSLGIREQVIFPEIDYNNIDRIRGLQVVIGTTAPNDAEGLRLLELMGMPFTRLQEEERVA